MMLQVLLEVAPQAALIACPNLNNDLPLHQILDHLDPPATLEHVTMVLSAHRKAVKNIPNYMGFLPTYIAADYAFLDMGKLTAEENMSNLSEFTPTGISVAHLAVYRYRFEIVQDIHSVMPEHRDLVFTLF